MIKLDQEKIEQALTFPMEVQVFDTIDSTNAEAKRQIRNGLDHPVLYLAEHQTAGRGRLGRSFDSGSHLGIYMTMAVPIEEDLQDAVRITAKTGVAVVRGIRECYDLDLKIKWVNDLYYKGKKISGILAEALQENGRTWIVNGIGINVAWESIPEELKDKAGSLDLPDADRNQMIGRIASWVYQEMTHLGDHAYLSDYRQLSMVLGKDVFYGTLPDLKPAHAEAIDETGALIVRTPEGEKVRLSTGEISLRLAET